MRKAQEDAAVLLAALEDEKRQGMEALVAMHNQTLSAFKEHIIAWRGVAWHGIAWHSMA